MNKVELSRLKEQEEYKIHQLRIWIIDWCAKFFIGGMIFLFIGPFIISFVLMIYLTFKQ